MLEFWEHEGVNVMPRVTEWMDASFCAVEEVTKLSWRTWKRSATVNSFGAVKLIAKLVWHAAKFTIVTESNWPFHKCQSLALHLVFFFFVKIYTLIVIHFYTYKDIHFTIILFVCHF